MGIKRALRELLVAESDSKELRKKLKSLRAIVTDRKEQIQNWMISKKVTELDAGPVRFTRRVSKRLPPLNRDFIESSLKAATQQGISGVQKMVQFIFDRRKNEKVEIEALSMRKARAGTQPAKKSGSVLPSVKEEESEVEEEELVAAEI